MTQESEFGSSFMGGTPELPVTSEVFLAGEGFDFDKTINSGGTIIRTDRLGSRIYDVLSSFDEETQDAIERILAGKDEGDPRSSVEYVLRYVRPSCVLTPSALFFQIAQDPKMAITSHEGVLFQVKSAIADGNLVSRNLTEGKGNPAFPEKTPHYVFEVSNVQSDVVLEENGIEYGAEIKAGIRLRTVDFFSVRSVLERLFRTNELTDPRIRKIIDPYFSLRLKPIDELIANDEDFQMW